MTSRRISASDKNYHPKYVVWELTLKCDQSCSHCGSRANLPRNNELTTKEAISLAKELVELKPKEVVLIGGEAYLHEGFYEIIKFLSYHQILVSMTTGGKSITPAIVEKSRIAGLKNVSISIDGLEPSHNLIRRNKGSFKAASNALEYFRSQGISIAANTNINRINKNELEELYQFLKISGIKSWQIQITTPLGRAADRPNLILQPWDLISLMPKISELKKERIKRESSLCQVTIWVTSVLKKKRFALLVNLVMIIGSVAKQESLLWGLSLTVESKDVHHCNPTHTLAGIYEIKV